MSKTNWYKEVTSNDLPETERLETQLYIYKDSGSAPVDYSEIEVGKIYFFTGNSMTAGMSGLVKINKKYVVGKKRTHDIMNNSAIAIEFEYESRGYIGYVDEFDKRSKFYNPITVYEGLHGLLASPSKARSKSPSKTRSKSPSKTRSKSPSKTRSKSPSKSPSKARSKSPSKGGRKTRRK